jgi:pectin methylesterase-like acyl-CoA thioesterase
MIIFSVFITFTFEICDAGSTIYVDDSGGKDYVTIQDAISSASNGDIIYIFNGTYYEELEINNHLI